jgi:hypothetical protein
MDPAHRWHLPDPLRFQENLRVTIQALGWHSGERYLPLRDDIASTAWWYQLEAEGIPEPEFTADSLEIT